MYTGDSRLKPVEIDDRQSDDTNAGSSAIVVSVNVGGIPAQEPMDVIDGQVQVVDELKVPMPTDTGTLVPADRVIAG